MEALDGTRLPSTLAIVDSGADSTTLPVEWAPRLGINVERDCERVPCNGVGGPTDNHVYADGIGVWVFDERLPLRATFAPGLEVILLGRMDFFDWYTITFDQRAKEFTIVPIEERPAP